MSKATLPLVPRNVSARRADGRVHDLREVHQRMINSLRHDKMTSFRDKFRSVDLSLIDDIQLLEQKERTKEKFFHTFKSMSALKATSPDIFL
jgi:chromosomal replication initiation ATPase DnaA